MRLEPDAPLSAIAASAIAEAFGLGEPMGASFVARGAMGSVNRLVTSREGERRDWTVKRSYWNQYAEPAIAAEVAFTIQCEAAGIPAPASIQRVDGGGYVLTVDDQPDGGSQYRVLAWVEGEVGRGDDPRTIPPIAGWMARIHELAVDPAGRSVDPWYIRVDYDWDELAGRLARRAPDLAGRLRSRRDDLRELVNLVSTTREPDAVMCHTDIAAGNLVWGSDGPHLIDWENAGPLGPHQELGCLVRSLGPLGRDAYLAYREAGGPAELTDVAHLASSVATHLNYVGCQAELLLDDDHLEQHGFARAQATGGVASLPNLRELDRSIKELRG